MHHVGGPKSSRFGKGKMRRMLYKNTTEIPKVPQGYHTEVFNFIFRKPTPNELFKRLSNAPTKLWTCQINYIFKNTYGDWSFLVFPDTVNILKRQQSSRFYADIMLSSNSKTLFSKIKKKEKKSNKYQLSFTKAQLILIKSVTTVVNCNLFVPLVINARSDESKKHAFKWETKQEIQRIGGKARYQYLSCHHFNLTLIAN